MSRRGGRVARLALRAGLVLGGLLCAWSAYDALTIDPAYAADRPPAGVVDDVSGLLRATLSPVLRPAAGTAGQPGESSPTDPVAAPGDGPTDRAELFPPAGRSPADAGRSGTRGSPGWPDASTGDTAPPGGTRGRPSDQRTRTAGDRHVAGRSRLPDGPPERVAETRRDADPGTPTRPPTRPSGDGLRLVRGTAPALALTPVTEPIRVGTLTPVAAIVAPVGDALRPVLGPTLAVLQPVGELLEPVLRPLEPVLEILQPVIPVLPADGPVVTPPPPTGATPLAAPPPTATPPVRTAPRADRSTPDLPDTRATTVTADAAAAGRSARVGHSVPRDAASQPAPAPEPVVPAPGPGGAGAPGGGHGDAAADAAAGTWSPTTGAGARRRPDPGTELPSRSPRPGSRPA